MLRDPGVHHGKSGAWMSVLIGCVALESMGPGCGRRATDADCRLIVDRSVELQMKEMSRTDTDAIAQRERQVRSELEDEIKSCESRRVTEATMACVRAASTVRELDACLR